MENRHLYRGKRIDNGEWVYGLPSCDEDGEIGEIEEWDEEDITFYPVDPTTICQCTGLKDKNGKLIFENDIVKCGNTTVVAWNEHFASWCLTKKGWMYHHFFGESQEPKDCEVIGNKFDNPELLE